MIFRDPAGWIVIGRAAEVREMDRRTIEELGIPGLVLMELAGAGTARLTLARAGEVPEGRVARALILCAGGNNGGDGYVIARHLLSAGWEVRCLATSDPARLRGDAKQNHSLFTKLGGQIRLAAQLGEERATIESWLTHADVVVDALFGTGLDRPIRGVAAELIELANRVGHGLRVAVDLPSGVAADSGACLGQAFRADLTATFGVGKPGLYQYPGAALAGEVQVVDIAMPRAVVMAVEPSVRLADDRAVAAALPERSPDTHKGSFGHVGVLAGLPGYEGAGVLASLGALRGGAGLVTWLRPPGAPPVARPPEVMSFEVRDALDPRSDTLVVGPGFGHGETAERFLALALASGRKLVIDADGLNLLARRGAPELPPETVITPHPAEAGRLLGSSAAEVQADRPAAATALVEKTGATVVLKGAGTLVASPGEPLTIIPAGDPTLATGGTGDVLAGLVGALRAQGLPPRIAAVVGAFVHGRAGERSGAAHAARGTLASETAAAIPEVVGQLKRGWS